MAKTDDEQEPWLSRNLTKVLAVIVFFAVFAATISAAIYYYHLGGLKISNVEPAGWGQMGDYFGGMLNPVFGFLTILAIVITLIQQSRELKLSREELELSRTELKNSAEALRGQNKAIERQSFEQTFFAWLNTYRDLLSELEAVGMSEDLRVSTQKYKGKPTLMFWWRNLLSERPICLEAKSALEAITHQEFNNDTDTLVEALKHLSHSHESITRVAMKAWDKLYNSHEYQLDSLFRVLYRLILWIDSQDNNRLSLPQKWLYVSIVRAQLSWIELVYIFYNGQTERGKGFKYLTNKYALFDNLNFATDAVLSIIQKYPPDSEGYQLSAYDSKLARIPMGLPLSSKEALAWAAEI